MTVNRRNFIKAAGGLALASVAGPLTTLSDIESSPPAFRTARVALFDEPTFPSIDIAPPDHDKLVKALNGFDLVMMDANAITTKLLAADFDLFINPNGSAFPLEAFAAILKYLEDGGNFLNLGGVPFAVPIDRDGGQWKQQVRQLTYHKKLGITQAFPIPGKTVITYRENDQVGDLHELIDEFQVDEIYELYVRFTATKDYPSEDGSAGARDAGLTPLVIGLDSAKQRCAAPFIQIDRIQGPFSGGRWILANIKGNITPKGIRLLALRALEGAIELTARSSFACLREGEQPSFSVRIIRPKRNIGHLLSGDCQIEIRDARGQRVDSLRLKLDVGGDLAIGTATMKSGSLQHGLYSVDVKVDVGSEFSSTTNSLHYKTGFWMYDKRLMESGKPLTVDKQFLSRDGEPYPVCGTTYMGSDTHRKFLFEPNPFVWDRDFGEMKAAGINMVRTGIWTGWKNYMLDVGAPSESALRALDAFIHTARAHDIPIILTLFAFLPEQWGGENPYLDPRSVDAQKEFVATLAQRYRMVNDVIWDLINEPSFCSPEHLWSCRPNYDKHEAASWKLWLRDHYPAATDEEHTTKVQEAYRATANEAFSLPSLEEFEESNLFGDKHPLKVVDYRLFAQDAFANWVKELTAAIRSNGNPHQRITVGQDEGGTSERPSPQFFGSVVDFTCIHNWWFDDDLVWDSVMTSVSGKPNLVEETGVMMYEKLDGSAWRSEEDVRHLLERKLAISIGAGGAGFVQWIWNTNPYMASDNEAAIGLFRADGTAKPELQPIRKFSKFISEHRNFLVGREEPEVLMVIPHSSIFSPRNSATEATQRCVRALYYHLHASVIAASEYRLSSLQSFPPLIVVPAPQLLAQAAWDVLLKAVEAGSTMLVSGPFDLDAHFFPTDRLTALGLSATRTPVAQEEILLIDDAEYYLSFRGEKIQRLEKAVVAGHPVQETIAISCGQGTIVWSPVPVENAESIGPAVAFYTLGLKHAGVQPQFSVQPDDSSILIISTAFEKVILYTIISETNRDVSLAVKDHATGSGFDVEVKAQRTAILFLQRKDGRLIRPVEKE